MGRRRKFVLLDNSAPQEDAADDEILKTSAASVAAEIQEIEEKPGFDPAFLINLDFRNRPDLLEAVRSLAESQFRSVQQQIMFILYEFCSEFIYEKPRK